MPTQQTSPPPEKMVRQLLVPEFSNGYYSELVERNSTRFQALSPIKRGTLYNSTVGSEQRIVDSFGGNLFFCNETVPLAGTIRGMVGDEFVIWNWASDLKAEDSYNAKVEYFLESTTYPLYTRPIKIRREVYDANPTTAGGTYGAALTGLLYIKVTAGGTAYASTDTVNVSSGSAAATLVIDGSGVITNIIVTIQGSGYDSAALPTISFTTTTGSGATAVAIVQDKTAVLIHQEKSELSANDPHAQEFVLITRVYRKITGPVLSGQEYDQQYNVAIPFTEQETAAGVGIGSVVGDIKPIDTIRQTTRTFDATAIQAVFDAYSLTFPGTANLELPDVLTSLTAYTSKGTVNGSYQEDSTSSSSGDTFYVSHSANGNAQGSASLSPDLSIEIKQYWARNVPTLNYVFFLPFPVTANQVMAKLLKIAAITSHTVTVTIASPGVFTWTSHTLSNGNAVALSTTGALPIGLSQGVTYYVVNTASNTFQLSATSGGTAINTSGSQSGTHTVYAGITAWPKFVPQAHTVILKGTKVSAEARAKSAAQVSSSSTSFSKGGTSGSGTSKDIQTSIKAVRIPPTIHPLITIDVAAFDLTADCTVRVIANGAITILGGTVGTNVDTGTLTNSAAASVTPSSIAATSVTTIPTTGTYLLQSRVNTSGNKWGYVPVAIELVDMSNVA